MNIKLQIIFFIILILPFPIRAQWVHLGLGDKTGNKIEIFNNKIYAGTKDGLYNKDLGGNDTIWSNLGLAGKEIYDFILFSPDTILACIRIYPPGTDTVSLFMTYDGGNNWNNYQNGF